MNVNEQIERAIKDFTKSLVEEIDEGRIATSFDLVDYTADYLNEFRETRKGVIEMKCPYCYEKARAILTKHADDYTVRLYRCTVCQSRFYTEESDVSLNRGKELMEECSKNE